MDAIERRLPFDIVKLLVFQLDETRYALRLSAVLRVIRAVEITRLPKAPDIILGVIDLHGQIIPIINIRKRFQLGDRDMSPEDQIVIAQTSARVVGLVIESTSSLTELSSASIVPPESIVPGIRYLEGVVRLENDIVFINDLEKFLSLDEEAQLDIAMSEPGAKTRA